jgi:phosphonate transport system permease protein
MIGAHQAEGVPETLGGIVLGGIVETFTGDAHLVDAFHREGPLAGVLAIITSDTGTLAKVYSEAVENVDKKQLDGVKATGAGTLQLYRFGALPQIMPVFLSLSLYFFESNTRSATILGIVGAGGIGLQLSERMRANLWDQTAFIILLILITVALIDHLSRLIRERFIGKRSL